MIKVNARWRFDGLFSDHPVMMTVAFLMLASCLNITTSAQAQTPPDAQSATCHENCAKEQAKCPELQTSEEMCDYDFKQCEKACDKK